MNDLNSKTLLLKPRMSEKAYAASQTKNVYVFDVPKDANKHTIARAVSAQFEVTVTSVNVTNIAGKAKRTVRKSGRAVMGRQNGVRKAYVTLKQGDTLPLFAAMEKEVEQSEKLEQASAKASAKAAAKETK